MSHDLTGHRSSVIYLGCMVRLAGPGRWDQHSHWEWRTCRWLTHEIWWFSIVGAQFRTGTWDSLHSWKNGAFQGMVSKSPPPRARMIFVWRIFPIQFVWWKDVKSQPALEVPVEPSWGTTVDARRSAMSCWWMRWPLVATRLWRRRGCLQRPHGWCHAEAL